MAEIDTRWRGERRVVVTVETTRPQIYVTAVGAQGLAGPPGPIGPEGPKGDPTGVWVRGGLPPLPEPPPDYNPLWVDLDDDEDSSWTDIYPQLDLRIGTVAESATQASAEIVGEAPDKILNLVLRTGSEGASAGVLTSKGDLLSRDASKAVRVPVGSAGQVLTADPAAAAGVAWKTPPVGNLLTANQASAETDLVGLTAAGFTIAVSSVAAKHGSRSVSATRSGETASAHVRTTKTAVQGGETYTLTASVRLLAGAPSQAKMRVWWFDAGGAAISNEATPGTGFVPGTQWRSDSLTVIAPVNAASAEIGVNLFAADGDAVLIDNIGFWQGAGGDWAMPGEPILNQGRRVTRPNGTDRLVEVWDGTAWVVVHYDSGWRDVSGSLINGWTGSTARIARNGSTITLYARVNQTAQDTGTTVLSIPVGWRPADAMGHWAQAAVSNGGTTRNVSVSKSSGAIVIYDREATRTYSLTFSWETADPTPTSLPGTPIGQAP